MKVILPARRLSLLYPIRTIFRLKLKAKPLQDAILGLFGLLDDYVIIPIGAKMKRVRKMTLILQQLTTDH